KDMRASVWLKAVALWLAPLVGQARELPAVNTLPGKPAAAAPAATCGDYGTSIEFDDTPQDAAKRALKEEKLVLVLHVSGHFEDPGLT
ncbi:MAG: hypothetical protein JNM56_37615, partial [Planctomycetia bacterium]|nr:hypothetical protein [Planctomycetia bacterium]